MLTPGVLLLALIHLPPANPNAWSSLERSIAPDPQDDDINWDEEPAIFDTPLAEARRIDDRPPVGIWWSEVIAQGQWQLGYRYQAQSFDGQRDGRTDRSSRQLLKKFDEVPDEMLWQTHTVDVTYGWGESTSVFASLPLVSKHLEGPVAAGKDLDQDATGVGDFVLGFMHSCCESEDGTGRLVLHFGVGLPTGSVDEEDDGPTGASQRLPYPMQLGTGTFDVHPGVYWIKNQETWTWGTGMRWRSPLDRNDEGYAPGGTTTFNAWGSRALNESLVGTLRLQAHFWGDYHGEDDELDKTENPLNDEHRQGGMRTDLYGGLAWDIDEEGRNRLEFELGVPVDEWLDGPQMSTEWVANLGWRYSF